MNKYTQDFEIKSCDMNKEGILTAILSTPDVDCYQDIVLPSAIAEEALIGVDVKLEHDNFKTVGHVICAKKEGLNTVVECELSPKSKYYKKTIEKIENKEYSGMSFGYFAKDFEMKDGKRILKNIEIKEVTITGKPANKSSKIMSFKSINSFDNFPIASLDTPWDPSKADMNIRRFLNSQNAPNEEYAKCFLWFDKYATENFTSYKLQLVDAINNELQIIPKAVKMAMNGVWNFMQYPEDQIANDTLRSLDTKIEFIRTEKKHEIKSKLLKSETTNEIMELWRESDNLGLGSNKIRDALFQAISNSVQDNLTKENKSDYKNSCPGYGVHVDGDKPKTDSSESTHQIDGVSKVKTESQAILDKDAVKQSLYNNIL